jgi:hypothetical protein
MVAPLAFTSERMPEPVATKAFGDWSGGGALRARGARALPRAVAHFMSIGGATRNERIFGGEKCDFSWNLQDVRHF